MDSILNSPKIKAKKLLLEAAENVLIEARKVWKAAGYEDKLFPNGDFGHFREKINDLYEEAILTEYTRLESEQSKPEIETDKKKSKSIRTL